ncbi:Fasciclin family protein [Croceitalea dokdonensis DOKDO 023]|uniref:Fasciclin family protein n=1 Tax=Croceitalea dokdonensis DOKDO 023 TaxID=1300341 RepID=A0A0P7ANR8_9FLAO|nr:fasciclin domain-containing protein [Croceitalea dokdonensis]KPM33633.1 Fasciclin family protein [Croceitalea dokdonensis DOKDO 023]
MKFPQQALVSLLCYFSISYCAAQTKNLVALTPMAFALEKDENLLQTTANTNDLRTLYTTLEKVNLSSLLEEEGPFTFFTPNNNAFKHLIHIGLEDLLMEENLPKLKAILSHHIIKGQLSAAQMLKQLTNNGGAVTYETLHGTKIYAVFKDGEILIQDGFGNCAKIVKADLNRSNGIIHKVDHLVFPSNF